MSVLLYCDQVSHDLKPFLPFLLFQAMNADASIQEAPISSNKNQSIKDPSVFVSIYPWSDCYVLELRIQITTNWKDPLLESHVF